MVGRILHFSQPYHLSVKLSQLVITNKDTGEVINRPIEDTAVLMLEHSQLTYTHAAMQELMAHNVAVVFCGADYHLPDCSSPSAEMYYSIIASKARSGQAYR